MLQMIKMRKALVGKDSRGFLFLQKVKGAILSHNSTEGKIRFKNYSLKGTTNCIPEGDVQC